MQQGQSEARKAIEIIQAHLNKSNNIVERCALSFAIGVIEGAFMLNCTPKEKVS